MKPEAKQLEESRRERLWDPCMRWKAIQETITWADAQTTAGINTPAHQLRAQREKRARLHSLQSNIT